jgi:hypothetical protein
MNVRRHLVFLVVLTAAASASAVCFDPKTLISGYRVPLTEEVDSAEIIVIGKVIGEKALSEDMEDPEGITAYLWTIELRRKLKGHSPRVFTVRVENDSSRYPMSSREEHLLFLIREGEYFYVDGCGNSSPLPAGNDTLRQVEAKLRNE